VDEEIGTFRVDDPLAVEEFYLSSLLQYDVIDNFVSLPCPYCSALHRGLLVWRHRTYLFNSN
jgi:hypothetical protein